MAVIGLVISKVRIFCCAIEHHYYPLSPYVFALQIPNISNQIKPNHETLYASQVHNKDVRCLGRVIDEQEFNYSYVWCNPTRNVCK